MSESQQHIKTAAFHTLGCRLNQAESSLLSQSFRQMGYAIVNEDQSADLHVVNTCTVTENADAKNRRLIRALHRQNPACQIAVIGCYAQLQEKAIEKLPGVKWIVGNEEKLNLARLILAEPDPALPVSYTQNIGRKNFSIEVLGGASLTTRGQLKIQDGCDFMCSFCVIPFARGRAKSRNWQNWLAEAKAQVDEGAKEIVLTGVNLGTYEEQGQTLLNVVLELQQLSGLERIRISSIEPTTIEPELLQLMADPTSKLVPYLHIPLQSGSHSVLQRMKRRYLAEDFVEQIERAYALIPDLCIGTDVMVGFPAETDEEFAATFNLLERLPIAYFHVFPFSKRSGTAAEKLPQLVTTEEIKRRARVLRELSERKREAFYLRYLKTRRQVLLENHDAKGILGGYTDNFIRVRLSQEQSKITPANSMIELYLSQLSADTIIAA